SCLDAEDFDIAGRPTSCHEEKISRGRQNHVERSDSEGGSCSDHRERAGRATTAVDRKNQNISRLGIPNVEITSGWIHDQEGRDRSVQRREVCPWGDFGDRAASGNGKQGNIIFAGIGGVEKLLRRMDDNRSYPRACTEGTGRQRCQRTRVG